MIEQYASLNFTKIRLQPPTVLVSVCASDVVTAIVTSVSITSVQVSILVSVEATSVAVAVVTS